MSTHNIWSHKERGKIYFHDALLTQRTGFSLRINESIFCQWLCVVDFSPEEVIAPLVNSSTDFLHFNPHHAKLTDNPLKQFCYFSLWKTGFDTLSKTVEMICIKRQAIFSVKKIRKLNFKKTSNAVQIPQVNGYTTRQEWSIMLQTHGWLIRTDELCP